MAINATAYSRCNEASWILSTPATCFFSTWRLQTTGIVMNQQEVPDQWRRSEHFTAERIVDLVGVSEMEETLRAVL